MVEVPVYVQLRKGSWKLRLVKAENASEEAIRHAAAKLGFFGDTVRLYELQKPAPGMDESLRKDMAKLARERARLNQLQRDLNALVYDASAGRAHHQGCSLGGLFTGMGADTSGTICWCGQHDLNGASQR